MSAVSASSPAPTAAASSSITTTRARVDPKRRVGLANTVAQGRLTHRVGIMSESELSAVRRLAKDEVDLHRAQKDAQRREASKARTKCWPDTVLAKQEAFLLRRETEKEEERQRKETLLELEALHVEEERRQKQTRLALKLLEDDPRGRNVRSLTMLDRAIKEREAQIAFKEDLKKKEEEARRAELELMERGKDDHLVREKKEKMDSRARNVAEKNSHLQQMHSQIEERKKLRAEKKKRRQEVEREAEEEMLENKNASEEEKRNIAAIHAYNRSISKVPLTKHDRLLERIKRDERTEAERIIQEEKVESMKREVMEKMKRKQEHFEKSKAEGFALFVQESEKSRQKERTQDVFERRGISMISKIAASEDRQKKRAAEERAFLLEESRRVAEGIVDQLPDGVRRAGVHRAGFIDDDEARAYQMEMQKHPARILAEQQAEAALRRKEAESLQTIHRLQAEEKKRNDRQALEEDVNSKKRRQKVMEEEDARYIEYVKSQLPPDMNPYLYAKATKLHY